MLLKSIGRALMVAGAAIGLATGGAVALHVSLPGVPWLVAVGMVKLVLLGSGTLMGAGAFVERLGRRRDERDRLPPGPAS